MDGLVEGEACFLFFVGATGNHPIPLYHAFNFSGKEPYHIYPSIVSPSKGRRGGKRNFPPPPTRGAEEVENGLVVSPALP